MRANKTADTASAQRVANWPTLGFAEAQSRDPERARLANAHGHGVSERRCHEVGSDGRFPILALFGVLAEHPVAGKELRVRHQPLQPPDEKAHVGRIPDRPEIRETDQRRIRRIDLECFRRGHVGEWLHPGRQTMLLQELREHRGGSLVQWAAAGNAKHRVIHLPVGA